MSGRAATAVVADVNYCTSVPEPEPGLSVEQQQAFPHCSTDCSAAPILLRNPTAALIALANISHTSILPQNNSC